METYYPFQLRYHAVHGWTAVYSTTTHLAQGQNWTLISKPLIRKELGRVLEETKIHFPIRFECVEICLSFMFCRSVKCPSLNQLILLYLQELRGSICQTELPQHPKLQLVAHCGSLSAVKCIGSLDLLCMSQFVQSSNHILYYRQWRHWKKQKIHVFHCFT